MNIRPLDLPELRMELATCLAKPEMAWFYEDRAVALQRRYDTQITAVELQEKEVAGLLCDELFFVTEEMYELAKAAAKSLPPFTLLPEDVPSKFGFAYLAPGTHVHGGSLDAVAVVEWWPTGSGVRLNFYCCTEWMLAKMTASEKTTPAEADHHRKTMGQLSPMAAEALIRFGHDPLPGASQEDEEFIRTIRAMWLLMQQPLAETLETQPDRAARKRLSRSGHEPATVRVINLRRPKSNSDANQGDREYHHQWIVRGHWRQQWYSARQVHRPVWIAPHIKGPEGAPLIGGEKVYALKR